VRAGARAGADDHSTILDAIPASNDGLDYDLNLQFVGSTRDAATGYVDTGYVDTSRVVDSRDSRFVPDSSWADRTYVERSSLVDYSMAENSSWRSSSSSTL
jgi:hypothetical protein